MWTIRAIDGAGMVSVCWKGEEIGREGGVVRSIEGWIQKEEREMEIGSYEECGLEL